MDNNLLLILTGITVILGILLIKRIGLASQATALQLIAQGATIVDVRTEQEYRSGSLPNTVNIPLDQLADRIQSVAPDRTAPVLLHCLSGSRSGMAKQLLKRMGYAQAHNLGSFRRARQLLKQARP